MGVDLLKHKYTFVPWCTRVFTRIVVATGVPNLNLRRLKFRNRNRNSEIKAGETWLLLFSTFLSRGREGRWESWAG